MTTTERPAEPAGRCTCRRPAVSVFVTERLGEVGWCRLSDGGDATGPCPFCGSGRHEGCCPRNTSFEQTRRSRRRGRRPRGSLSRQRGWRIRHQDAAQHRRTPKESGATMTQLLRNDTPLILGLLDEFVGHGRDPAKGGGPVPRSR